MISTQKLTEVITLTMLTGDGAPINAIKTTPFFFLYNMFFIMHNLCKLFCKLQKFPRLINYSFKYSLYYWLLKESVLTFFRTIFIHNIILNIEISRY